MKKIAEFYIEDLNVNIIGSNSNEDHLLFIHGGPGLNNQSLIDYSLEYNLFNDLNYNIIFYDQRACGKSKNSSKTNNYKTQIDDLQNIYQNLNSQFKVKGIIGQSYGANLLYDFQLQYNISTNLFFLSMASNINTPRLNNIKLDLEFLKESDVILYEQVLSDFSKKSVWEISEDLANIFHKNTIRPNRYWHNQDAQKAYTEISEKNPYKINSDIFTSLRKELYQGNINEMDLNNVKCNWRSLIGYHDYIMNGHLIQKNSNNYIFYKSAHYPHIEENSLFCKVINDAVI